MSKARTGTAQACLFRCGDSNGLVKPLRPAAAERTATLDAASRIARDFFVSDEVVICPHCQEEIEVLLSYQDKAPWLKADCHQCGSSFSWHQTAPERSWDKIHLAYFRERVQAGVDLRCPLDDCRVSHTIYAEGTCEFRCPFCNRKGRIASEELTPQSDLTFESNESIVFLTI